jgi:hypothetical protein
MAEITTEQYQQLRDQLAGLLDRSVALPGLLPKSQDELALARKKLLENQFELVLVGEFQVGKSTTFNVLNGSRELSPRGKNGGGLKTSGCIVRTSHLSDPNDEEHAIITWRTPEQIVLGFERVLLSSDTSDQQIESNLDLQTAAGRRRIKELTERAIERFRGDRASFPTGYVDMLRFALLSLRYFENPELKELKKRKRFKVDETLTLMTFPTDWETRWEPLDPSVFNPAEVIFSFIASVEFRIKSERLSRMGAAIVDCPGMFASPWDTQVAMKAIASADAILYLVTGDKQLSLSDLHQLDAIRINPELVFLAPNVKFVSWTQAERIGAATAEILRREGFPIDTSRICLYNARLAIHGGQLECGLNNLDDATLSELRADFQKLSESSPPDDELLQQRMIDKVGNMIQILEELRYQDLPAEHDLPRKAIEVSKINELLNSIENFILESKAQATLEGNAERATSALSETEGALKYQESVAQQKLEECQREFTEAEERLSEFENRAKCLLDGFGLRAPEFVGAALRDHILSDREAFVRELSKELAPKLRKVFLSFHTDKDSVVNSIRPIVANAFQNWTQKQITSWLGKVNAGKETAYTEWIKSPLNDLVGEINSLWYNINANKPLKILEGIHTSKNVSLINLPRFQTDYIVNIISEEIDRALSDRIQFGGLLLALIAMSLIAIATFITWPIVIPILVLLGFKAGAVKNALTAEKALYEKLNPEFDSLVGGLEKATVDALKDHLNTIKCSLQSNLLSHPRELYVSRRDAAKQSFNEAEGSRMRIAEEAKSIRKTKIAPIQKELDLFLKDLGKFWPRSNAFRERILKI